MCEVEETSRALSPSGSTHVLEGGGGGLQRTDRGGSFTSTPI